MKVLVTGAGGSGGSYLIEHLLNLNPGLRIDALVRKKSESVLHNLRKVASQVQIIECDLCDRELVRRVIEKSQPDQIYHFASNAKVGDSFLRPLEVIDNNIHTTSHLLDALRVLNLKPKTLICSTSEVYGQVQADEVPIRESNALRPASPYAVSKVTQDLLAQVYSKAYQIPIVITRMFTYINPRRFDLFASSFALQIAEIEAGLKKKLLHGNLDSVRTVIDIRDAMEAYELAMKHGVPGEIYNLGGKQVLKVGEFLDILKSKARCFIPSEVDPTLLRPVDVTLQIPDTSKFQNLTGWQPSRSLDESVDLLLEECRLKVKAL